MAAPKKSLCRVLPIALLAACASSPSGSSAWTHPVKDPSEWKVDMTECERFFGGSEKDKMTCMGSKGWHFRK